MARLNFLGFRGLLPAIGAIAAAMTALDVLLRCLLGSQPGWMPPRYYEYIPYFGGRVARVEQLERRGEVDDAHLAVAMGTSQVQYGFDPAVLESADPSHRRWLVLGASGATIRTTEICCRPFLDSSLHPSLIVIGIETWMLHRNDWRTYETGLPLLSRYSWLVHYHNALDNLAYIQRDFGAASVGRLMRIPLWQTYAPAADPWASDQTFPTEHASTGELASIWTNLQFETEADQFRGNENECDSFVRLMKRLRQHAARVVCVLMPESSQTRPYPPATEASFARALARLDEPLEIIDMRAALDDSMMHDYTHVNRAGRARLSALIPPAIQADISPPPG